MSTRPVRERLRIVRPAPDPRADAPTSGRLVEVTEDGQPVVTIDGDPGARRRVAMLAVEVGRQHVGRPVLLVFVDGDPERPVITGVLSERVAEGTPHRREIAAEELMLRGEKELTLVCGAARITLTHDGRVLIRGVDVLSRASGTHRVRAGSIQLN